MSRIAIAAALASILLVAACAPATPPAPSVLEVTVIGKEFSFDPAQLSFAAGQRVRLTFVNQGSIDHEIEFEGMRAENVMLDWSRAGAVPDEEKEEIAEHAEEGEVEAYAAPGGTTVVEFTPAASGTFEFVCGLPGHEEAGMVGSLVIR